MLMQLFPTINQAYGMLVQDEKNKELTTQAQSVNESMAFAVKRPFSNHYKNTPNAYKLYNSNPGASRFSSNSSKPLTAEQRKAGYFCDHCKIFGHTISRCFKVHGYPDKSKSVVAAVSSTYSEQNAQVLTS